jgi:O-antigen ligase
MTYPKKISDYFLLAILLLCGVLVGLKPALIAHIIVLGGFFLVLCWRDERGQFARTDAVLPIFFGALLAWLAASLQWSLLPARGMYDFIILILLSGLALQLPAGAAQLASTKKINYMKIFTAAFAVGLIIFAMDICFNLVWQRALLQRDWQSHLGLAQANRASFCIILILWPLLHFTWQQGWRILAFLLWLGVGILIFVSESTAAHMAFILSSLIFITAIWQANIVRLMMLGVLLSSCIIALPVAHQIQDLWNTTPALAQHSSGSSAAHRTEIWQFTAQRIAEKPILGWGFNSARAIPNGSAVSVYQGHDPMKSIIPMHPHNWILHAFLELGVVGLSLFAMCCAWVLYQIRRLKTSLQSAALASYSVAMVIGMFSISLWSNWWWASLLLTATIFQLLQNENHRTGQ